MKLYFVRHGQTDANVAMTNGKSIAELDQSLNSVGIEQAWKISEELRDAAFDAIVSSPLRRALETAEIINNHHHLPVTIDDAWRERQAGEYIDINIWQDQDLFDFDKNLQIDDCEHLNDFLTEYMERLRSFRKNIVIKLFLSCRTGAFSTLSMLT